MKNILEEIILPILSKPQKTSDMRIIVFLVTVFFFLSRYSFGQSDSSTENLSKIPNRFFRKMADKSSGLDNDLTNQTEKYLRRLEEKENKLKDQLAKLDPSDVANFSNSHPEQKYLSFLQKIKLDSASSNPSMGPEYLPYVDSLRCGLAFLNKNPQLLAGSKILPQNIQNSLDQLKLLQTKMQDADQIKQFLQTRKAQIQDLLSKYSHLPPGITKLYGEYNKEVFYYSEQVREYREMLNDPDKMAKTALQLLNKVPAFTSFMKKNSFLAGLFNIPDNYGTPAGMEGLQSRDQVLSLIKSQMGRGGSSATAMLQQSLQTAQQDINKLRDKVSALGAGSSDMEMPNFKPNPEHTKTLFQRLEYGTSLITQHANLYFPTTTNIGLSAAYKFDEKKSIGIKVGYNIGWGSDINHIRVSNQGVSFGSFIDVQIKRGFFVSGGYELNYQEPVHINQLSRALPDFQRSGLLGVGKMVKMNSKLFKKTKVQVMWNFLSYYQVPQTTPILFQVGYTF